MERQSFDDARDGAFGRRIDWLAVSEDAMAGLYLRGCYGDRWGVCYCDLFQFLGENVWARAFGPHPGDGPNDDRDRISNWAAAAGQMLCLDRFLRGGVLCACSARCGDSRRRVIGQTAS